MLIGPGCEPPDEQGSRPEQPSQAGCHVKPNYPHESGPAADKRGSIVGKVQLWCDKSVDRVVGSARLERRQGRTWVIVPNTVGRLPVRDPKKGKKYVTQAIGQCESGTYRTAGFAYAVRDGKVYEMNTWIHSQSVTNPCSER